MFSACITNASYVIFVAILFALNVALIFTIWHSVTAIITDDHVGLNVSLIAACIVVGCRIIVLSVSEICISVDDTNFI